MPPCLCVIQALQLVADVHSLADQVRSKCGPKDAERTISGTLTPRFSAILENDNQVSAAGHQLEMQVYFSCVPLLL